MDLMKTVSKYRIKEIDSGSIERELNRIESEKQRLVKYKNDSKSTGFEQLSKTIDVKQFDENIISNKTSVEAAKLSEKYLVVERICDTILKKTQVGKEFRNYANEKLRNYSNETKWIFQGQSRVSPIGDDQYLCAFTADSYVGNVPQDIIEAAADAEDVCDKFEVWRPLSSEEMYGLSEEHKMEVKLVDPLLIGVTKYGNCLVLGVWDDNDLDIGD